MTTNELKNLMKIYFEICDEVGMEWTAKGYKYFIEVMYEDYINYCKIEQVEPSWQAFKRCSIEIAAGMIKEAVNI